MTASYVIVSALAVLIVEAVLLIFVAPRMRAAMHVIEYAQNASAQTKVVKVAAEDAAMLSEVARRISAEGGPPSGLLAEVAAQGAKSTRFGQVSPPPDAVEAITSLDSVVVFSSNQSRLPVGSRLTPEAAAPSPRSGTLERDGRPFSWATGPVTVTGASAKNSGTPGPQEVIGTVYVEVGHGSIEVDLAPGIPPLPTGAFSQSQGLLLPGLIILVLLIPLGVLFGLLTTRRLIGRVRRLVERTSAVADGDLRSRIEVSGDDEVGRLEDGVNRMAERLEAAVEAERVAAGIAARRIERNRIARELHDSISQDLFSINLLAGGLRRALPEGSTLHHQAESMEKTVDRTMHEMRAMLLELRPVALEDAGLVPALEEMCGAYETRLDIRISRSIAAVTLSPEAEHAVLRVVQEALSNATRHGGARRIELSLAELEGVVMAAVEDDGTGFDPAHAGAKHGMGLILMRERVTELGGTLEIRSAPGEGTSVRLRIPGRTS
ncbi:histidine kinase [Dactylosporangium sp. NPDC050688]|uniref:HAMP domain-containing sensor histidine kinase n=1 Tax=Dactylosporangium sp. NPDC050688 TaxID=3157217 RepID=UPI00340C58CC